LLLLLISVLRYPENELKPMSVEELEVGILESRKDVAEGRFRTSEELKNRFLKPNRF